MKKSLLLKIAFLAAGTLAVMSCGKIDPNPDPEPDPEPAKMGTIQRISLYSESMHRQLSTTVWLPGGYDEAQTYPVLYLLHGYGDDNNSWILKGNASLIADDYMAKKGVPMIIVMPDGLTEFYRGNYETYFHDILIPAVEEQFHGNGKRALAGLSMGGYGTLLHALKYPDKFTYAYAMSPAADEAAFSALAQAREASAFPPITVESGTQDYTVSIVGVRSLVQTLKSCGLRCDFIERDGGHDWNFWPECLKKALVKVGESFK